MMDIKEAVELWKSNKYHLIAEEVEGFPTGNVYMGMTYGDFCKLDKFFEEQDTTPKVAFMENKE